MGKGTGETNLWEHPAIYPVHSALASAQAGSMFQRASPKQANARQSFCRPPEALQRGASDESWGLPPSVGFREIAIARWRE
jgi:hypothetical protein